MANLFIDCEFNGMNGGLISMALVSEDAQREFYEVVECNEALDPWVRENVMPILGKPAISWAEFQERLKKFLKQFPGVTIYANHPDDFAHFCKTIIEAPGVWMMIQPLKMIIDDAISGKASKVHHNALEDARAQRESWLKVNGLV